MERLRGFPETIEEVVPTRLGNALRAMESYGKSRYGLDSQTFWYEIQAVASPELKGAVDESQGGTDFFISAVAHLLLLSTVAFITAVAHPTVAVIVVTAGSAALIYPAYRQAVNNVGEWRWSLQALMNTSRPALAASLSLRLPATHDEEAVMWKNMSDLIHYGRNTETLRKLDMYRIAAVEKATPDH